jgi:hypothetical protein
MSKKTVTLYKPDGTVMVWENVKAAYKDDKGTLIIQLGDHDTYVNGKLINTTLPFMLTES